LNSTADEIDALINEYELSSKALREEALRMCWYMRGGLTYTEAMYLSNSEKDLINKIIKDNMQTTKDSGLPFF
jgi:hypothetical protein